MIRPAGPTQLVLGMMGRTPFAGVAWQALHYLEGFRRLGCDVYYMEDSGSWPYDPEQNRTTGDSRYTTRFLDRMLAWCGLPGLGLGDAVLPAVERLRALLVAHPPDVIYLPHPGEAHPDHAAALSV
jgi:hypothetical protein